MTEADTNRTAESEAPPAEVPAGWQQYLRLIGPGFFIAMAWLGTGDLIDSSVSGVTYGYALMWALLVALITKWFFMSALSKYMLANNQGDTSIMQGFARIWKGLPVLSGLAMGFLLFVYESYFISGAGTAMFQLTGIGGETWGVFIWAVIAIAAAIIILRSGRAYKIMEIFARITVAVLAATFIASAIIKGINVPELLAGLTFKLPPNVGLFGSLLVAVALMGVIGTTPATLAYPYAIREKGWQTPSHRKLQIFDAFTAIAAIAVIDLAIWATAAESSRGLGATIESPEDLAAMMERAVGSFGPPLLWLALFFVTFSSIGSSAYIYSKICVDGVRQGMPARSARYSDLDDDPWSRWMPLAALTLPLIFSTPWAPNVIILTVLGSTFAVISVPIIVIGITLLTSSRRWMLPGWVNRWWEVVLLLIVIGIAFWAVYGAVKGVVDALSTMLAG